MRTLQPAIGLKIKAICEMKLVKMLTADVDHRRHITIAGGIRSYSYNQYDHFNRLGNNLLRMRPVCTCTTSLHSTTINVICVCYFFHMAPAEMHPRAVYINTHILKNYEMVYIRRKSNPKQARGDILPWLWSVRKREVRSDRTIKWGGMSRVRS
jgi:hypothetical protein